MDFTLGIADRSIHPDERNALNLAASPAATEVESYARNAREDSMTSSYDCAARTITGLARPDVWIVLTYGSNKINSYDGFNGYAITTDQR